MAKHKVGPTACPYCLEIHDGASNAEQGVTARPKPGDIAFCANCGYPSAYGAATTRRKLTTKELNELIRDFEKEASQHGVTN